MGRPSPSPLHGANVSLVPLATVLIFLPFLHGCLDHDHCLGSLEQLMTKSREWSPCPCYLSLATGWLSYLAYL